MRILYVQADNGVGGSGIALLRMIGALDRSRYTPIVALPYEGPLSQLLQKAGAELRYTPMRQLRTLPSPAYQFGYCAALLPSVLRLRDLILAERIDLVHSNTLYSFYGVLAARRARRAHIWHVREIPPAVPIARRLLAAAALRLSTIVIAMSQACIAGLFGAGEAPSKVVLLPDGVDLRRWQSRADAQRIRSELGLAADIPLVGFVARLDPWKGLDVFLRAAQRVSLRLPRARFLVVGDAPEGFERHRDEMIALATRLGLAERVQFLGWRYKLDDIPEVMAALDVLCHTPVRPEPFGLVLIEAMAAGCPVVAPRAGGPQEIVEDGISGWLVAPGDPDAFAERVCRVIISPDEQSRLAAGGRRRVAERYSSARFGAELARIYERARLSG